MTPDEIFVTLLTFLITGIVLSFVALVLFTLFAVMEWLRCHLHNIEFEDFCKFYIESFLPTMTILFVTAIVLKFFLSVRGG